MSLLLATASPVAVAYYAYPPVNLQQRNSDGTALCTGCTTAQGAEVQLTADSISSTCANIDYYLDFEVRPVGTPFTGTPTHTSPSMMKPSCVQQTYPWTSITGLAAGQSYHWQVRERTMYGSAAWVLFNGGAAAFTTGTAPAYHLAFTTSSQTVGEGACSGINTVQRQDASNAAAPVAASTAVALGDSLSYTTFYSDPGCTTAVTQVTMPASSSTASFYWKTTTLLNHTVLADMAGAQWAGQLETVVAGPPSYLSFYIYNSYVDVHACSVSRQLNLYDAYNNPATVSSSVVVSLTSDAGSTFYTDPGCTTQVTSLTFPAGTNTLTFYSKENQVGMATWTASSGTLTSATSYEYGYGRIAITSSAQTLTAGQCSPLPFTFETRDGLGAVLPVATRTAFNLYGSGVTFHSGSNCNGQGSTSINLSTGSSTGTLYWKGTWAGTVSLQVSASYYNYVSQNQTVNPIVPPIKLGFTSYAQTVIVGNCSAANTVASQDTYANTSPVTTAKVVTLSASLAGTSFYSDSSCTTALTGNQVTIPAGSGIAPSFYWKATNPGSLVVTATAAGLTSATITHTVEPRLVFTTLPQTITAGSCSTIMTVQTQNASGAAAPVSAATPIYLYTYSYYGAFYSDSACANAITQINIPNGGSTASFYYRDTMAGTATLYIYGSYIPAVLQDETIVAGPSAQLAFTTYAQVVGKTLCSGMTTVAQQDQYANNSIDAAARTVALTTSSATMIFYSESTCTTPLAGNSLTIPVGGSTASFWFSDTTVGNPTITAASTGLTSAQQQETISLGAATRLAFAVNGVQTLGAGACSAQVTLQSRNAGDNPENVIADTVVDLTSTSAQGGFYSDSGCTASISSVTLLTGTNSKPFFWKDTRAGTPTLTASTLGMLSTTAIQTVNPGTPAKISFATAAQSIAAGACSQLTTIQTSDNYDNASNVGGAKTVLLTSSSPGGSFYSDASCTAQISSVVVSGGSHAASFYWKDFSTGTPTLTASDQAAVLSPGTQGQTVGGRNQIAFRWYSSSGVPLAAENAMAEISPGTSVHLRVGVQVDAFTWRLSPGDVLATGETLANYETVSGNYTATFADDTTYETLTERKLGTGSSAQYILGDPNAAGSAFHVYSFGSGAPAGRPSYDLCLVAMTTGETLNVGWSATSTPGTPAFPGWQITTTGSPAETCFDLKAQGYAGGPLSIYLQDAIRGPGSDRTTGDTFTIDRVYVRGYAPTYLSLDRATLSDFSDAVPIAAGELWNDAANTNGGLLASRLASTDTNEVFVETRPSVPGAQQDIGPGAQGEWDFALVLPATAGTYYYRMVLTNSAGTKTGDLETLTTPAVVQSPASQLAFTTVAQTVTAGVCSGAATVERRDAAGNPRPAPADLTINLSSAPAGAAFYSDPTCLTPLAGGALPLPAGQSAATFYWKDTLAGSPVLTAAMAGLTSATQTQTVLPDVPASLLYTTAAQSLNTYTCSAAVTVQSLDQYGNPSPVAISTSIGIASNPPAGISFYSVAGCGGGIVSSVTMAGATSTATFYFRATLAASYAVTATAPFGSRVQTETVTAIPPTVLAFTTAAQTLTAGACSGPVTVETRDSFGTPSAVSSPLQVNLAAAPSTGFTFYSAAGCTGAITSVTVPAAGTTATFYFQGTAAGSVVVTASATAFTSATQTETINAGAPTKLVFTTAAQSISAGSCSAAASLRTTDDYGNASPVGAATTVNLGVSPTTGFGFYAVAGCGAGTVSSVSIAGGTSTASFFFRGTATGSFAVTATVPFATAPQTETINPLAPTVLAFTTAAQTLAAGTCSGPVTVQTQDTLGNPSAVASALSVNLLAAPNTGFTFYSLVGCSGPTAAVSIPAASNSATFYFRGTAAGSVVVTASATAFTSATQTEVINAGAPTKLAFASAPQTLTAGSCSATVTVVATDNYGNLSPVATQKLVPLSSTSGGNSFFAGAGCTTPLGGTLTIAASTSSVTYSFRDTTSGTPTHTADGSGVGLSLVTQTHTLNPAGPSELRFTSAAQILPAGQCSAQAAVRVYDSLGNPTTLAAGGTASLSSTSGTLRFYQDGACATSIASASIAPGAGTTTFYFRDTQVGLPHTTATVPTLLAADQQQRIDPGAAAALVFKTAPQTLVAGTCSGPLTVEVQDAYGNASPAAGGLPLTLASTSGGNAFFTDAACATPLVSAQVASGASQLTYHFRDTVAGTPTQTAQAALLTQASQTETIRPAAATALSVANFPSPAVSGQQGTFSVTALDPYSNVATGYLGTVTFQSSDGAATLPGAFAFTGASAGTASLQATLRTAGTQSLTARESGGTGLAGTQANIVVNPGAPVQLVVSGIPSPVVAGAAASATIVVHDASANVVVGYAGTVHFTSTDPGATLPADFAFTAGDLGTHTFTGISFATPGTQDLRATDTGAPAVTGAQTGISVQQRQGGACATNGICATGFCANSVCCDSACGSACHACDLAGSVGTCSPEPNGTTCPNATYCDGVEVCQAGACVAGSPVSCVDPLGDLPMQCDEAQRACVEVGGVAPAIARDATLTAAVGLPYRYNAEARIRALGTRPVTFGSCGGPAELHVDAKTGDVAWTPAAAGDVPLCLNASNAFGPDSYAFTVTVAATAAGAAPVASLSAAPLEGAAPLDVAYDGTASTVDPSTALVGDLWEFGDGSPWLTGTTASNHFFLPGGTNSTLTVFDGVGRQGSARAGIRARDAAGRLPPLARITASAVRGTDSLDVDFACDCQPGDAALSSYQWDFGDGTATGATAKHTFGPGRYHVRLTAVDQSGLTGSDVIEVTVARGTQQPPRCRAFALPPAGVAPLDVRHRLVYGDDDGTVASAVLTFPDGTSTTEVDSSRAYPTPGAFPARLLVTDDSNLTCMDQVQVVAVAAPSAPTPPRFLSSGTRAAVCGVEWRYSESGPQLSGDGPYQWSLLPVGGALPDGMTLDAATGQVTWLPTSAQKGEHRAILRVRGAGGTSDQLLDVVVDCSGPISYSAGCCSSSGPGVAWMPIGFLVLLWLHRAGRRRQA